MDYKQKYENLLNNIKAFQARFSNNCSIRKELKECVEELRESEDERIRKALIKLNKVLRKEIFEEEGITKEQAISWFEKQKPTDVKPHGGSANNPYDMSFEEAQEYTFHRGFDIPMNDGEVFVDERYITQTIGNILKWADDNPKQRPIGFEDIDKAFLEYADNLPSDGEVTHDNITEPYWNFNSIRKAFKDGFLRQKQNDWKNDLRKYKAGQEHKESEILNNPEKYGLQKKCEWSEEDELHINYITTLLEDKKKEYTESGKKNIEKEIDWLKSLKPQPKQEWSEEDEAIIEDAIKIINRYGNIITGQDESNRVYLIADKLKSLKPQPKQEWSEEDERIRKCLISQQEEELEKVKNDKYGHSEIISDLKEMYRERIDWLKSIKPQPHWKPSEDEIRTLQEACSNIRNGIRPYCSELVVLEQLLNELKTLRDYE